MYKSLIRELVAGSKVSLKCCNTSSTPTCALLPTENTEENLNPFVMPDSRIKIAVPPELDMRSHPCGSILGMGDVKRL